MKFKWFNGIDISKKTLDATMYDKASLKKPKHIKVSNNLNGFRELIRWIRKQGSLIKESLISMEHTGVYGNDLAVFLDQKRISYSMIPITY